MRKEIIVGIDFSNASLTALRLSIDIANRTDCNVLMLWVQTAEKDPLEAEETFKELCRSFTPSLNGKEITYKIVQGKRVHTTINKTVKEREPYMLIIGTNGNSGFDERFAGANAFKTLSDCPVPVLLLRENFNFNKPLENIILPIDSTLDTRQKVPWTIEFAHMFPQSCIRVLGLLSYSGKTIRDEVRSYVSSVEKLLDQKGLNYTVDIRESDNSTLTTLDYAKEVDADMIVIMTEQEKTLSNLFFLGPYAQQMINLSPYPVLTIAPKQINGAAK
ncbi:MAG: universal stress protein [Bacteroidales bacterium]|nr:universal stress protein [Bacteroidales bacterium]